MKVMRVLVRKWRAFGIRIVIYLDDSLGYVPHRGYTTSYELWYDDLNDEPAVRT